jgi:hypothetical protein
VGGGIRDVDAIFLAIAGILFLVMFINRGNISIGGSPSGATFAVGYTGK